MVQTSFTVTDEADLTTDLASISVGGANAAPNTAYTFTITAPIAFTGNHTLDLDSGSSLEMTGAAVIATGYSFTVTGSITSDLNFTGTITLDNGTLDNVAITNNGSGQIIAGEYSGQVLGTSGDNGDAVVNDGSIAYTGGDAAIDLGMSGTSTVQNTGTIDASNSTADGVILATGTVDNGTTSATSAFITAGEDGVAITGAGLVDNDGTITGTNDAGVHVGSGTIDNGSNADTTAEITSQLNGVLVDTGSGIVNNFGTIMVPGGAGVDLEQGGTVTNGSSADTTALISASINGILVGTLNSDSSGTVTNYGTIIANGSDLVNTIVGVNLRGGGTVDNLGSLSEISAVDYAVLIRDDAGSVENEGSIVATGTNGFGIDLVAGGTVMNGLAAGSLATIQGTYDGVRIEGNGSAANGATVQNDGTITGSVGVDFNPGGVAAAGTLINDGLIEGTSGQAVTFGAGQERLVLDADGSFEGGVIGSTASGSSTTLELANGTTGTVSGLIDSPVTEGTVTDTAGSFNFYEFGTILVDAGASWTIDSPGTFPDAYSAGTLTIASGATISLVEIQSGGTVDQDGTATSAQTFDFALGDVATLALLAPNSGAVNAVAATIDDFGLNGTIDLLSVQNSLVTSFNYQGTTLYVLDNSTTLAALDLPGPFVTNDFTHSADNVAVTPGTFITTSVLPCFATGTAIRTPQGAVPVQELRVGGHVVCAEGSVRPVVWIGHRRVNVERHPSPEEVAPVRVQRDAFGAGMPARDLLLSPDHAVYVDDVLIPVKHLINGRNIVQIEVQEIEYWHVELDRHDVLLAEDLPVESFLDTGNRAIFADHDRPVMMHRDFAAAAAADAPSLLWEALGYAPLVVGGEELRRVRRRLALRADGDGAMLSKAPADQPRATA